MRAHAFVVPMVLFCAWSLTATPSSAQSNAAAAQTLFEEARQLMAKGDYAAACTKLEGSQALDPGPGTEYNLAACYEKSGRTASAWAAYLDAASAYKATNRLDWEARARARATALATSLSRVTIVAPASASTVRISRDGKPLQPSELGSAIPVDPGPHVVEATTDGKPPFRSAFTLPAGGNQTVRIVFSEAVAPSSSRQSSQKTEEPSGVRTVGTYALAGVGAAGIVFGGVAGLIALGKNNASNQDCPNDGICTSSRALSANDTARDWATISTVSFITGAVLLTAGAVLFFTMPNKGTSTARSRFPLVLGAW